MQKDFDGWNIQIRVLDSKRLLRKIGTMEQEEFAAMKKKLTKVLL